ncbi:uncharacterized protein LOC107040142 [Diachasma alloeum]|uniref:uncharacterized protein LOC107040142 n=1 Tax=Diachasma alloeum TaxID=454923 RepID=UPI000738244B|nr:uncharacterized protein LOC107040142 [Diachasma alloeum]
MASNNVKLSVLDDDETSNMSTSSIAASDEENWTIGEKIETMREDMDLNETKSTENGIEKPSLIDACARRPYLDGTWFKPIMEESSFEVGVFAMCQVCYNEHSKATKIKGSVSSVSNYKTHVKLCHKKRLSEFEIYCAAKKIRVADTSRQENGVTYHFVQSVFDANICNCVLQTFMRFNIVEEPSFIKIFT